jgi:hypothetical protein
MSTVQSCAVCVSLSQKHYAASMQRAQAFGKSAVNYVGANARVKKIEDQMIAHVKVCNVP